MSHNYNSWHPVAFFQQFAGKRMITLDAINMLSDTDKAKLHAIMSEIALNAQTRSTQEAREGNHSLSGEFGNLADALARENAAFYMGDY